MRMTIQYTTVSSEPVFYNVVTLYGIPRIGRDAPVTIWNTLTPGRKQL